MAKHTRLFPPRDPRGLASQLPKAGRGTLDYTTPRDEASPDGGVDGNRIETRTHRVTIVPSRSR